MAVAVVVAVRSKTAANAAGCVTMGGATEFAPFSLPVPKKNFQWTEATEELSKTGARFVREICVRSRYCILVVSRSLIILTSNL